MPLTGDERQTLLGLAVSAGTNVTDIKQNTLGALEEFKTEPGDARAGLKSTLIDASKTGVNFLIDGLTKVQGELKASVAMENGQQKRTTGDFENMASSHRVVVEALYNEASKKIEKAIDDYKTADGKLKSLTYSVGGRSSAINTAKATVGYIEKIKETHLTHQIDVKIQEHREAEAKKPKVPGY